MADLKFGKRPPKRHAALQLTQLLTGVVPVHPDAVDHLAAMGGGWKMLGNDKYGDCVAVTWANMRRLVTAMLGDREVYATIDQVYAVYKTQNPGFIPNPSAPGQDDGMDIQTLLEYLVKVGGPDGVKALAFAQVDPKNLAEVDAAIAIFGSLWTGMNVLNANMTEFDQGKPWDFVAGSGIAGGHSVITAGYASKTPKNDGKSVTWGQEISFTDAFVLNEVDEMWVVIWPEHIGSKAFQQGVDLTALAAAYTVLTGRPFPVAPQPAPAPAPGPADPADAALADATRVWAGARHSGANHLAAVALNAWLKAKHL